MFISFQVSNDTRFRLRWLILVILMPVIMPGYAVTGEWGLRTNLLYWLTSTPNIGVDYRIAEHWSVSMATGFNAFKFPNHLNSTGSLVNPKLSHWTLQADGKYWLRNDFRGFNIGLNIIGGEFNVGGFSFPRFLRDSRYEGWGLGGGVNVGYAHKFSSRLGLEASLGGGLFHLNYAKYDCGSCGHHRKSRSRNHPAITKAEISLFYIISGDFRTTDSKKKSHGSELNKGIEPIYNLSAEKLLVFGDTIDVNDSKLYANSVTDFDGDTENQIRDSLLTVKCDTSKFVIRFPVNMSGCQVTFRNNKSELKRLSMLLDSISSSDSYKRINKIEIIGYASPEYDENYNLGLSEERARSAALYLIENESLPEVVFSVKGVGDDWKGLYSALSNSSISEAEDLKVRITERKSSADLKEFIRLRDEGRLYKKLLDQIYPELRRVEIMVVLSTRCEVEG